MKHSGHDVCCIVRAAGERTADACVRCLSQQVPSAAVETVSEVPFAETYRKAIELGIARDQRWTLMVDADILPRQDLVPRITSVAESLDNTWLRILPRANCKLIGGPRHGGVNLYNTRHLRRAMTFADKAGSEVRPESYVNLRMAEVGYPTLLVSDTVGLHDYEQSYADLYRKGVFLTKKVPQLAGVRREMWLRLGREDDDFKAAWCGSVDADHNFGRVDSDIRQFERPQIQHRLAGLGMGEKDPLDADNGSLLSFADDTMREFHPQPEYWQCELVAATGAQTRRAKLHRLRRAMARVRVAFRPLRWWLGTAR